MAFLIACSRCSFASCVLSVLWLAIFCPLVRGIGSCPSVSQDRAELVETSDRLLVAGDLHSALACGERLVSIYPKEALGFEVLASVCFQGGDHSCCIRFSERSAALRLSGTVEKARAQIRLANCLAAVESWSRSLASYQDASSCSKLSNEELATAYNNLGNVHRMMQRNHEAIQNYMASASFAPTFADAYFNAGGLLVEAGQIAEGTSALWSAVAAEPASEDNWRALAGALESAGSPDAPRAFHTMLLLAQDQRRHSAGIGGALASKDVLLWARSMVRGGDVRGGVSAARRALRQLRESAGAGREEEEVMWAARVAGDVAGAGAKNEAVGMLQELRLLPGLSGGELRSVAAVYAGNALRDYDSAVVVLEAAWAGGAASALAGLLSALQTTCGWEQVEELLPAARTAGWEGLGPYEALYLGVTPAELRAIAQAAAQTLNDRSQQLLHPAHTDHNTAWQASTSWWRLASEWGLRRGPGGGAGGGVVVVGFVSSDMKLSHPLGQLLLPLLRALPAATVTAVCIDTHWQGPGRSSAAWEAELQVACGGRMVRGGRWGAREGGEQLNGLGLHAVVNLDGWAGEDRMEWLVGRPAPVQVNALGYPGTSGCAFIDLLLADAVSAPPELASAFSERLLLLPPSHHPFPHRHSFGAAPPAPPVPREEVGLPGAREGRVVVACFNRLKKLDRRTWDGWLWLLAQEPSAVLWLSRLALSPGAEARLRERAAAEGLEAGRVVVSGPVASSQHLATKAMADLLLDTPRYNGHLSAGDALWATLPMVVLPGLSLASRISASLASASPAVFVARSLSDYLSLALALIRRPALRARARAALERERHLGPLFDTRLWAFRLQRALRLAVDLAAQGPDTTCWPCHVVAAA